MPLGWFEIKNLYRAQLNPDFKFGGKKNLFMIHVSSWYKKDTIKSTRKYYFSVKSREQLYNWIITLNFLKVKEIYNEFANQFGVIHLPLDYETKRKIKNKTIKKKFKGIQINIKTSKSYTNYYNLYARKSVSINCSLGDKHMLSTNDFQSLGKSDSSVI